jgi:uncharacterized protein (DUF1800 family)
MTFDRRGFLRLAALSAAAVATAGCGPLSQAFRNHNLMDAGGSRLPAPEWELLARMCYGVSASEVASVREYGIAAWTEEQLGQAAVDPGLRWRLRNLDLVSCNADELDGYKKGQVIAGLRQATLLRQVYGRSQLYEMMVEFWGDHLNISMEKGDGWRLKIVDDREVIRPNALGNFRELLSASAHSPAMQVYLDNQANNYQAPNENYARELLELHTLGVDGGYTQADVMELARCLTGWSVKDHFWRGEITFNAAAHDPGVKSVLGLAVEPAGEREMEQVLDRLALHPATAQHLAVKLVRRFVCDDPLAARPELVSRAAGSFLKTGGDLAAMLRTVLFDGLLREPYPLQPKVKRPVDFIASALRVIEAETDAGEPIHEHLVSMGQPTFAWPTPDGPPDTSEIWITNLAPRWRFALQLGEGELSGTSSGIDALHDERMGDGPARLVEVLSGKILGPRLAAEAQGRLEAAFRSSDLEDGAVKARALVSGLLASPQFQYR